MRDVEYVNIIISAWNAPQDDPIVRKLLLSHITHGPWGSENRTAICMKDRFFTKGFQIQIIYEAGKGEDLGSKFYVTLDRTLKGHDMKPAIRRTLMSEVTPYIQKNVFVGHWWVVPDKSHLLFTFACHVNVYICLPTSGRSNNFLNMAVNDNVTKKSIS